MKVYKDGKTMNADKDQMEIVLDAGWSKTKPEVEPKKIADKKVVEVKEIEKVSEIADKKVVEVKEADKIPKPKKIRKINPKKK